MTAALGPWVCATCAARYDETSQPPAACAICQDERQYVGWDGQEWLRESDIAAAHEVVLADDHGLLGIDLSPGFAINQRALLLPTGAGNILWEAPCAISDTAIEQVRRAGGVDLIAISHPHFYAAMLEWSQAFGGAPIYVHHADQEWSLRSSPHINAWSGDHLALSDDVTLIRCGGHFAGSTTLHWRDGPNKGGSLFPADALQVAMDRRSVSFMYSYPNLVPMTAADVRAMRQRLAPYAFESVYGYSRNRVIARDGHALVDRSFDRFLARCSAGDETTAAKV